MRPCELALDWPSGRDAPSPKLPCEVGGDCGCQFAAIFDSARWLLWRSDLYARAVLRAGGREVLTEQRTRERHCQNIRRSEVI